MSSDWITPEKFNENLVSVSLSPREGGNIERYSVLYQYHPNSEPSNLLITVPLNTNAYLSCKGIRKETFNNGIRIIETNRYAAHFFINHNNKFHKALFDLFVKLKKKLDAITDGEVQVPFAIHPDKIKCTIYSNLIHSNDGKMYSRAYTHDKQSVDILSVKSCIARPLFLVSLNKNSDNKMKLKLQVSELMVHENIQQPETSFALAYID